jgi:hypothetical protein
VGSEVSPSHPDPDFPGYANAFFLSGDWRKISNNQILWVLALLFAEIYSSIRAPPVLICMQSSQHASCLANALVDTIALVLRL